MPCDGNSQKTCCRIKGKDCRYLIYDYTDENGYFRKFACSLYAELRDWDKVLEDPRYKKHIEGSWAPGVNCRDWPDKGPFPGCPNCGVNWRK